MAQAFTRWLEHLCTGTTGRVLFPQPNRRKPIEIEVERLPDYFWRDLGFQQPRRGGE
jgi:hypothetical protein